MKHKDAWAIGSSEIFIFFPLEWWQLHFFFRSMVFGGFDGVVSSLVIVSGATGEMHSHFVLFPNSWNWKQFSLAGGNTDWLNAAIIGFSYIAVHSIYLGISEFLSASAHRDFLHAEKRRALWEFKNYREEELNEVSWSSYFVVFSFFNTDANALFMICAIFFVCDVCTHVKNTPNLLFSHRWSRNLNLVVCYERMQRLWSIKWHCTRTSLLVVW